MILSTDFHPLLSPQTASATRPLTAQLKSSSLSSRRQRTQLPRSLARTGKLALAHRLFPFGTLLLSALCVHPKSYNEATPSRVSPSSDLRPRCQGNAYLNCTHKITRKLSEQRPLFSACLHLDPAMRSNAEDLNDALLDVVQSERHLFGSLALAALLHGAPALLWLLLVELQHDADGRIARRAVRGVVASQSTLARQLSTVKRDDVARANRRVRSAI